MTNNFYIITGGPGVGKTTLINQLALLEYTIIEEDARKIIKDQILKDEDGLPWKNKKRYAELMLSASIKSHNDISLKKINKIVFFDRGILDTICYMNMEKIEITNTIVEKIQPITYNSNVFILPPWKEIYENDRERKQNWREAEATYYAMKNTYLTYGYNVIEVPKISVNKRVKFILNMIQSL